MTAMMLQLGSLAQHSRTSALTAAAQHGHISKPNPLKRDSKWKAQRVQLNLCFSHSQALIHPVFALHD